MIGIAQSSPSVNGLVFRHEARKRARVDAAVAVRYRLERDVVHARHAAGRPLREVGKAAAVFLGQVPPGRADLFLDQVEVVEQPFARRRDAQPRPDGRRQHVERADQHAFVLVEPVEQSRARPRRAQGVNAGEGPAVLLHLVGAEQLGAQRRLVIRLDGAGARAAHAVAKCRGSTNEGVRKESAAHRRESSRFLRGFRMRSGRFTR
jgi:hypothetical protein